MPFNLGYLKLIKLIMVMIIPLRLRRCAPFVFHLDRYALDTRFLVVQEIILRNLTMADFLKI